MFPYPLPDNVAKIYHLCAESSLLIRSFLQAEEPYDLTLSSLSDREWVKDRIHEASQRWNTQSMHTLASLWWFSLSRSLAGTAFASYALSGQALVLEDDNPMAYRSSDGYITGILAQRSSDLDESCEALSVICEEAIDSICAASRHSVAPYRALLSDATAMVASSISIRIPPDRRPAIWEKLRIFCNTFRQYIPMPPLRLIESELTPDSQVMTLIDTRPDWEPYLRNSCCLIYRADAEHGHCRDCPRAPYSHAEFLRQTSMRPRKSLDHLQ